MRLPRLLRQVVLFTIWRIRPGILKRRRAGKLHYFQEYNTIFANASRYHNLTLKSIVHLIMLENVLRYFELGVGQFDL